MDSPVVSKSFVLTERGGTARTTPPKPGCPACGWSLNPAGRVWRCGRCQFILCIGCCVAETSEDEGE